MGKKTPDTPDVVGAAKAEGAMSREAQRDQIYADRPDQYNAFGSNTWGQESYIDPATGERSTKWTQAEGLSPDMQKLLDSQMGQMQGRADMSDTAFQRAQAEMAGGPDWQQFGEAQGMEYDPTQLRQRAEDAAYGRATSRLDPRFAQEGESLEVSLRNKGLRPGDQAYDSAMGNFDRSKTDAYSQAQQSAVGQGMGESQQLWNQQMQGTETANALRDKKIEEYLSKRQFSMGEANALDPTANVGNLTSTYSAGGGA